MKPKEIKWPGNQCQRWLGHRIWPKSRCTSWWCPPASRMEAPSKKCFHFQAFCCLYCQNALWDRQKEGFPFHKNTRPTWLESPNSWAIKHGIEPSSTHSPDPYSLNKHTKFPQTEDRRLLLIQRQSDPHAGQVWEVIAKPSSKSNPKAHCTLPVIHLGQGIEPVLTSF
jgi:hypothetical protein